MAFLLDGVLGAHGDQGDVLGLPSFVEEALDLIVRGVHDVVQGRRDELDGGAVPTS